MDIEKLSLEELKAGFHEGEQEGNFICNICGQCFEEGEVYPMSGHFFTAARAAAYHAQSAHSGRLQNLLFLESKYNTLTENQKELLSLFHTNLTDQEIAKQLDVAPSTVRHHKFMFREKAKQAKLYLAAYGLAMEKQQAGEEDILPPHSHAKMVDERYVTTRKEQLEVCRNLFESMEPLRLRIFPAKEKKKIVVLAKIAEQFTVGRRFPEKEINEIIRLIYDDYALIRRYLIEYGFMNRTTDCQEYWRAEEN